MLPCYFTGEIFNDTEQRRRHLQLQQEKSGHFYSMQLAPGLIIDARRKGNVARLINTSCDPNCETQKWTDASTGK